VEELHRRGYAIYAASNCRFPYIESILRASQLLPYFDDLPFVDYRTIHNKVDLVSHILKDHSLRPEEALMVGDRTSDRDAALKNGVYFAACRYGHGSEEEWKGAHLYIDSIGELLEHLAGA
jgi:phosphoglycolate phosphatase